jgi:hypothetical protein
MGKNAIWVKMLGKMLGRNAGLKCWVKMLSKNAG